MVGFPRRRSETAEANEPDFTPATFRDGTVSRWRTNFHLTELRIRTTKGRLDPLTTTQAATSDSSIYYSAGSLTVRSGPPYNPDEITRD